MKSLENAVIKQLGYKVLDSDCENTLKDIANNGADGGFTGFTYYADTTSFFKKNKTTILQHAKDLAKDLGERVTQMIGNFRCLNGDFSEDEIAKVIYGHWKDDNTHVMIANAMAWFILEEVAVACTERQDK